MSLWEVVDDIMGKGENAGYHHIRDNQQHQSINWTINQTNKQTTEQPNIELHFKNILVQNFVSW